MTRGVPATFELDLDALFELGLGAMLDGLRPLVDGPARLIRPRA